MKKKEKNINNFILNSEGSNLELKPIFDLTLQNAKTYNQFIQNFKYLKGKSAFVLNLSEVKSYDSFFVVLTLAIQNECEKLNIKFEIINIDEQMSHYLKVLTPKTNPLIISQKRNYFIEYIENIGKMVAEMISDAMKLVEFLGNLILKLIILPFRPTKMRWKDFPHHFLQAGVNAVPITLLIVFLIGLISGYQGALQLSKFGADIFIADLIGISITRELAPLMTAILVAGRSGAAFAAEIGTMKVSEEVDALNSMSFDYMNFLVLPRVLAVVIAMPILVLITDIAGIAGGLVAALSTLEITVTGYINQLNRAITFFDVFTGIGKSIFFGFLISGIGCFRGMQVRGGAESVGKYTTASVVTGIFLIIVFDALFTYLFQILGI